MLTLNCRHKADIWLIHTECLHAKVCFLLLWFSPLAVAEQCWAAHLKPSNNKKNGHWIVHCQPPKHLIFIWYSSLCFCFWIHYNTKYNEYIISVSSDNNYIYYLFWWNCILFFYWFNFYFTRTFPIEIPDFFSKGVLAKTAASNISQKTNKSHDADTDWRVSTEHALIWWLHCS